jgi:hypothetical protein
LLLLLLLLLLLYIMSYQRGSLVAMQRTVACGFNRNDVVEGIR